jgi:hypothetical protein
MKRIPTTMNFWFTEQKRKRLDHPRQAQDEPPGKAFFAFLGGLACDLEGVGAEAGR